MPKLPVTTPKKLLKAMLKLGFYIHHQNGSHINLLHQDKTHLRVVIPNHRRDLAPKTLKTILGQAEVSVEEIVKYL